MSLLLVTEIFPPRIGGSGRWFWEIYSRLPRDEVAIAAGTAPGEEAFDRTHDLKVQRLDLTMRSWGVCGVESFASYGRSIRALRKLARARNVRTLHCARCLPEGLMALALKFTSGLPYVCYAHGEELNFASASRELTWLARRVFNASRFVVANSRNTQSLLCERWGLPPERTKVLTPGVDVERFVPAPRHEAVRDALGWGSRPVVLTVGRLQRRKGHDQMISALKLIRHTVPDVLYAIVGDGEERERLQALVVSEGQEGHVQFLGAVGDEHMIQCYQQCDVFVLPNRQDGEDIEGFGMVLVEAQACGKPVVAGASGGTAETMRAPDTGQIVSCEGSDALADVVSKLLIDEPLRTQMGTSAREWAASQFDWNTLSRQAARLFDLNPDAGAA
jgi:phosphatidyl-myo-inositol dimannoside synthase